MESTDVTVWGVGTSRTMRVHWMLLELGLEYTCHPIQSRTGETHTDEFKQLNPRHKIPVLRHGSLVVTESTAIIQYLSETFPDSSEIYAPHDAVSRAKLNEWCYFIISELDAGSLYVIRRHEGLRQIYGEAPNAVESARSYFLHNLEAMAARIGGAHTYLLGEQLSAADILIDDVSRLGGLLRNCSTGDRVALSAAGRVTPSIPGGAQEELLRSRSERR